MRTEEEITDLIKEIDNGLGTSEDKEYLGNVKAALLQVLKKLAAGQEVPNIEEELRKLMSTSFAKLIEGELDEDEIKALTEFMNRDFEGQFKIADNEGLLAATCNVEDAWSWVMGKISKTQFLSESYLKLK